MSNHYLNQTTPITANELYNLKIGHPPGDWGIQGYKVPCKNPLQTQPQQKVSLSRRQSLFIDSQKRAKQPDPTKYATSHQQVNKYNWKKRASKFPKSKKVTVTQQVMKQAKKLPGPGAYNEIPKGKQQKLRRFSLGNIDKHKGTDFMSTTLFLAKQIPGSTTYFKTEQDLQKSLMLKENRKPVFKYNKAQTKKVLKQSVGPGYLKNLEQTLDNNVNRPQSAKYGFRRAKHGDSISDSARRMKFVPGVGHYKDREKAFAKNIVVSKGRMVYISKCKGIRTIEDEANKKKWVPGPGAYNIPGYKK